MLQIHNTLSGRKEVFKPLVPGTVRMYACGITVYDYCHLGHARMLIVFDTVRKYLRHLGYHVTFVRNITDIDDKIIMRAAENHEPISELTARFIRAMWDDYAALGVERGDHEPRATEYVPAIVSMVNRLVRKGYAYAAANGDVYFSVAKFADYGKLSGKKLEDLRAGARVEVNEAKQDPLDFVLWKASKPGEPSWDSPWGQGRPGWHIECSAMSTQILGPHFDIHCGGMDLMFPHHENEIAQSCCACDAPFVNYWMHNGFVRVDNEKMSKSLGNFFTIREVLGWVRDPEVIRFFMLSSHYRGPINYSVDNLDQADAGLERIYLALRGLDLPTEVTRSAASDRFEAAMNDDFNTPLALSELQQLAKEINVAKAAGNTAQAAQLAAELVSLATVLGVAQQVPDIFLRKAAPKRGPEAYSTKAARAASQMEGTMLSDAQIDELIKLRTAARKSKDWKESDRIRDELSAHGVLLEDAAQGTTWRRR
ncbi:MAG: cysteine--tRNA ligase [Steroidobacteraceae bacterium]